MTDTPRAVALGWLASLALATASGADCLPVEPGIYPFEFGSFVGSIDFVGCSPGVPDGGVVLEGEVEPTDVTASFAIVLDPESAEVGWLAIGLFDPETFLLIDRSGGEDATRSFRRWYPSRQARPRPLQRWSRRLQQRMVGVERSCRNGGRPPRTPHPIAS